jgi:hypothetical protein
MQKSIALSTAEAEYYSVSEMAIEMIYRRTLLAIMGLPQKDYTEVFEDNTACIEWANHVLGGRERAKHIDIHTHFAHEVVQHRHILLDPDGVAARRPPHQAASAGPLRAVPLQPPRGGSEASRRS